MGLALLVFAAGVATDLAFVWWTRATQSLQFWGVVASSALIQLFAMAALLVVVREPTLVVANVAGHAVGSGAGVAIARRRIKS